MSAPQRRWVEFWQTLGTKTDPAPYFAQLEAHYSEPHRAYHNLRHVMDCLRELDSAKQILADAPAVEMAIWYHDVIYDARAKDNEERSAALAVQVANQIRSPALRVEQVKALICATKKHDASVDQAAPVIVDIDLSILGASPERFDEYERQIRREYDWVPDDAFGAGRAGILEGFLSRPTLYSTSFFRNKYERQARENLQRSIRRLRD